MLAGGLGAILYTGKWINDITAIGFPHVLNVKCTELLDKSSHYLVEHDFWNGHYLHHEERATKSRQCAACRHHMKAGSNALGLFSDGERDDPFYDDDDARLLKAIETKAMQDGNVQTTEIDMEGAKLQLDGTDDPYDLSTNNSDGRTKVNEQTRNQSLQWMEARLESNEPSTQQNKEVKAYRLLERLIATVHDEYGRGSRGHWGAEDRRTKLWFIVLTQNTIGGLFVGLISGLGPVIAHFIFKITDNIH
jgi:hypothetical protein